VRTLRAVALGAVLLVGALGGCSQPDRTAGQPADRSPSTGARSIGTSAPTPSTPAPSSPAGTPPDLRPRSLPPNSGTGITGITLLTGGCPVMTAEPACPDRAISASVNVLDVQTNTVAGTVTSGADGRFTLTLAPGRYLVQPTGTGPFMARAAPVAVEVTKGAFAQVTVRYRGHLS